MNIRLLVKIVTVGVVALLLLLPVGQVESLVHERQGLRDTAVAEMAKSGGYAQTVTGPFLVVPYERIVRGWTEETKEKPRQAVEHLEVGNLVFLPAQFDFSGQVGTEERARGIYEARFFALDSVLKGTFQVPPNYGVTEGLADVSFGKSYVVLGLSDVRGIDAGLQLRWNDSDIPFAPGTVPAGSKHGAILPTVVASGVHGVVPNPETIGVAQSLSFQIQLRVRGTGELRVAPIGRDSRVELMSNWPHPSFIGDLLPKDRAIGDQGFRAHWETSFFATNLEGLVERCQLSAEQACTELAAKPFGVSFVDPVDHYLQSERATKYAFLFVGLTFSVLFLFEVLRRHSVHPIQYGLVGLALAVFFLLLLSLSEHLGFAAAYAISACVNVLLIGYYSVSILGNLRRALGFGVALGVLYGVLFGILKSEDYALVSGALVVFMVLGLVMVLTRHVNWSKFGQMQAPGVGVELDPKP